MTGAEGHVGYVPNNFETLDESTFAFDKEQFDSFPDNVNVDGYRQTEKYFRHIENKIRKDFAFNTDIMKPCRKFMKQFAGGRVVFLHVRRGDNVGRPDFYPIPRVEYYKRVLDKHSFFYNENNHTTCVYCYEKNFSLDYEHYICNYHRKEAMFI